MQEIQINPLVNNNNKLKVGHHLVSQSIQAKIFIFNHL